MTLPRRARLFLWLTAVTAALLLGGALAALLMPQPTSAEANGSLWVGLPGLPGEVTTAAVVVAQLVLLGALAQHFPLRIGPQRKLDLSLGMHLAILLLVGLPWAIVLVGLSEACGQLTLALRRNPKTGKRLRGVPGAIFNTSQMVIAAALASTAATVVAVGAHRLGLSLEALPLATLAAVATLYLVNSWSVATMAALAMRRSPVIVWLDERAWNTVQAAGVLTLGAITAHAAAESPWVPLAMTLPAALTYLSLRRTAEAEAGVRLRDEFLGLAAHELRTPLTSLRGYAQLLARQAEQRSGVDPEKLARCLRTIDHQSGKLCDLIDELLDIARMDGGRLSLDRQRLDVGQMAREVAESLQPLINDYRLVVLSGPTPVLADADRMRLEQVLTNLVTNAARYAHNGDRIEIEVASVAPATTRLPDTAPRRGAAGRTGAAEPPKVRLAVRDFGVGIAPEHRERIFDRFYQTGADSKAGGLGLGLYITRQIVELHGGRITVECPPNGGTRFVVTLPAALPVPATTPAPDVPVAAPVGAVSSVAAPEPIEIAGTIAAATAAAAPEAAANGSRGRFVLA